LQNFGFNKAGNFWFLNGEGLHNKRDGIWANMKETTVNMILKNIVFITHRIFRVLKVHPVVWNFLKFTHK